MKHEIWQLKPDESGLEVSLAIENVIQNLALQINKNEFSEKIISLAFFIDSGKKEFNVQRRLIISRLKDVFKNPPAFSIIGQPPASNEKVLLEVNVISMSSAEATIQYGKVNDEISYTKVETNDFCEVYYSGLTVSDENKSIYDKIFDSFAILETALLEQGLGMNNIVRQWNYLENIIEEKLCDDGILQNYQSLNNIRHTFYSKYKFCNGYPSATGIGMNSGGFILECIAVKEKHDLQIMPVQNPAQISAYDYSNKVLIGSQMHALSTPKFERAKLYAFELNCYELFISGTAAIHSEGSLAKENSEEQTIITLENIDTLFNSASERLNKFNKRVIDHSLSYLRVYIKRRDDFIKVKAICDKYAGSTKPVYLIADICRDELLVEIEGLINIRTDDMASAE